ncbi:hypothetical protein DSC45_25000 [Streptomyces sp. YIM 130001]|uniref:winged helix DNA-binding domain-containing protein n=1 Tax=Streptomyces sp. YIM 130001 TaxID=2259644 RepID=UPI000E653CAA|nr:winged helix DNA-binding domain-containing protein [Streptomyces sp. YIM 130001]RII13112.1 hypothetical protein DSC45_25000 [Streptomyces sp. YIM 130001]
MDTSTGRRLSRARAQLVGGQARAASVAGALEQVCAVQAQDFGAAGLGLRARVVGLDADGVRDAIEVERTAVRGWFMRGTLQIVPAADVRRLLGLFGPVHLARGARRLRELGLDEGMCARAERLIVRAIDGEGPLNRTQLTALLGTSGVPRRGQSAFHLIRRAALSGLICHGPHRDGEAAFVLLDDWLPDSGPLSFSGRDAEVELARRYRSAHGPSDAQDFARWSGLRKSVAQRAWAEAGTSAAGEAATGEDGSAGAPEPDVRLLPAFDNYLLAYGSRELSVPAADERRVWPGGGMIRPTVMVDGRAVGTWSGGRGGVEPRVEPFPGSEPFTAGVVAGIARESADVARFHASGDQGALRG